MEKEDVEPESAVEFEDDKLLTPVERVLRQMSVVSSRSNRVSFILFYHFWENCARLKNLTCVSF